MPIHNAHFADQNNQVPPDRVLEALGPTIQVMVGVAPVPDADGSMSFSGQQVLALIDTGASTSCISDELATNLGLTPIDRQTIHGVSGPQEHLVYLAMISVPQLQTHHRGRFVGVNMQQSQPVLLGRDFLRGTVFIYHGPAGTITLCR